jgi:hypothetical protein
MARGELIDQDQLPFLGSKNLEDTKSCILDS